MNNVSPELTTLCLIALGVGVLILLAAGLLLAVLRGSLFGFGMMVMRMMSEPPKEETRIDLSSISQSSDDLRAKAHSIDFDAAVARYRHDSQNQAPSPDSPPAPNAPAVEPPPPHIQGFPPPRSKPPHDDEPLELR